MNAPVPARVEATVKDVLLGLVDHAIEAGWALSKACHLLGISTRRVQRWITRRHVHQLVDARPGGSVNALLPTEIEAILGLFDTWGEKDHSHRRLAHRGFYTNTFWASPATVRRVLHEADLHFRPLPRPGKSKRKPFPDWASYIHPGSSRRMQHGVTTPVESPQPATGLQPADRLAPPELVRLKPLGPSWPRRPWPRAVQPY
ncbi:MAG: hypothetical protein H0U62_09400 [Actinobacteria bacterium]|nr:hypothetical protein [Actinomycetota bacterium]